MRLHRLVTALLVGLLAMVAVTPITSQAVTATSASSKGSSCAHPVTFFKKGSDLRNHQKFSGSGYHISISETDWGSGRPSTVSVDITLKRHYRICSLRTSNPATYSIWPKPNKLYELEKRSSSWIKAKIARSVTPRGTNCGKDAYRRLYDQGQGFDGDRKHIKLTGRKATPSGGAYSARTYKWEGLHGVQICWAREVSQGAKVLWKLDSKGAHTSNYPLTDNPAERPAFVEVAARKG